MKKITKHSEKQERKIVLDISGFDRSTIIRRIRGVYKRGYDEIQIYYSNTETAFLRKADRVPVRDVVRDQVIRMMGAQITIIDAHNAILHIKRPEANLDDVINRIIKKIIDIHGEFILLIKGHLYATALIEEKHESLTKLVSYCHLLIGENADFNGTAKYHLLAHADMIADLIKYMTRDYITVQRPMSNTAISIMMELHECLVLFDRLFTQYSAQNVTAVSLKRDDVKRKMRESIKHFDSQEAFILGQATCILEVLVDMLEYRMMLEDK
jgi:hypothetical protein